MPYQNESKGISYQENIPLLNDDITLLYQSKLNLLDILISEIDSELSKRQSTHDQFILEMNELITLVDSQIDDFRTIMSPSIITIKLRVQVFAFELDLRKIEEGAGYWRDRQVLLKERRELMRERLEMERRGRLLGNDSG